MKRSALRSPRPDDERVALILLFWKGVCSWVWSTTTQKVAPRWGEAISSTLQFLSSYLRNKATGGMEVTERLCVLKVRGHVLDGGSSSDASVFCIRHTDPFKIKATVHDWPHIWNWSYGTSPSWNTKLLFLQCPLVFNDWSSASQSHDKPKNQLNKSSFYLLKKCKRLCFDLGGAWRTCCNKISVLENIYRKRVLRNATFEKMPFSGCCQFF